MYDRFCQSLAKKSKKISEICYNKLCGFDIVKISAFRECAHIIRTPVVRQLTYFAVREKDKGRRCNRFALAYEISRVLSGARNPNIFEGAARIQVQEIARGRLTELN